jgi:signal peptidase II
MGNAGLALLLGGAAGNVSDRIFHGAVTDFFEVWLGTYHYPAFNVADSAIVVGVGIMFLQSFQQAREAEAEARATRTASGGGGDLASAKKP